MVALSGRVSTTRGQATAVAVERGSDGVSHAPHRDRKGERATGGGDVPSDDAPGALHSRTRSPRRSGPVTPPAFATRPLPPADMNGTMAYDGPAFVPAPEIAVWLRRVFCDAESGSPLHNPEHAHLAAVTFGVLWAAEPAGRHGRSIVGQAEIPRPAGRVWAKQRATAQLVAWFGAVPTALLTFSAEYARAADDAAWCALAEHELYHLAHKHTSEGAPMFSRETGEPVLELRGHDYEQFGGVVRRYGAGAAGVRGLVEAASQAAREPVFPAGAVAGACGTCAR